MKTQRGRPAKTHVLPIRALGLRANVNEAKLLDKAAELDKRDRNAFCLTASLEAARKIFIVHGVTEDDILVPPARKRA